MKRPPRRSSARLIAGAVLCAILPASSARAHVTSVHRRTLVPSHLEVGSQSFDASAEGLRSYLEGIRGTDPALFAQLAPDVARLEARRTTGFALLGGGAALAVFSTVYAFAGRTTCPRPSIDAPFSTFAAETEAWANCNDANRSHMTTFALLGLGLLLAGSIGAAIAMPKRNDVLEVVNKRNRLTPQPMQLHLGYDPRGASAFAGAKLTF